MKETGVWALGMMSGTSLDGVDGAMIRTDGVQIFEFGPSDYRPYTHAERAILHAARGKWPGELGVAEAAKVIEATHVDLAAKFSGVEVIGFHGQTLAHDPAHGRTHQVGDGAALAQALRLPVVWDFRSADVAMGGQGAPLVPYFHHACARFIGATSPLAILNLGGVGNVTWINPNIPRPEDAGAVLAFDTGPANAPINDIMQARTALTQDTGGVLAATGTVHTASLQAFLRHSYFSRLPPKSLDRDEFSPHFLALDHLSDADAVATATAIAAACVAASAAHFPAQPSKLLVAGGGRHNSALMGMIKDALTFPAYAIEDVGLNGDMLEAQAFGYLALRVMRGLPTSGPCTTGAPAQISGGQIYRPD